ncbi:hypothetical protein C5167_031688 [Papaver somniferum]|uniref:Uncharacterized protein n=1 Tax=Papaver somniferum TaxID=3469 RepID=A0A4Y7K6H9_PAPSO|nr:hypothetical protein C5167_031688 [Papaver somniferum]
MTTLRIGCGPKLRVIGTSNTISSAAPKTWGASWHIRGANFWTFAVLQAWGAAQQTRADTFHTLESAKDLGSSLEDRRSKFLDLRSCFTGLGSIPIDKRRPFTPLDQRQRPQELLFGPAELLYISRDQLNRPQNDCTWVTGIDVWDWIPRSLGS